MKIHILESLPSGMILRIQTEEETDEGVDRESLRTMAVIMDPTAEPPIALWLSDEDILKIALSLNIFLDIPSKMRDDLDTAPITDP